jgi:hypothetical protein
VGVLAAEHVEAELARLGGILRLDDKPESRGGIDEPADEPGAGHPINEDVRPGHPGRGTWDPAVGLRPASHRPFGAFPAGRIEEIIPHRRLQTAAQPLGRPADPRFPFDLAVFRVGRTPERRNQFGIARTGQKSGPAQGRLAALRVDLPEQPLEVLSRVLPIG